MRPSSIALFAACLVASPTFGLNYTESIDGDFSNDRLSPTFWGALQAGTNTLIGSTSSSDLDYFTINIPTGSNLTGLKMVSFDSGDSGDETGFIGVQIGTQMTVPPDAQNANGLLGWSHFGPGVGDVGQDILPFIGSQGFGSTGFVPPLPSNSYTFWIQQLNFDPTTYHFDFIVTAASVGVPGDYNSNGVVDAADYVKWRDSVGQATLPNRGSGITGNVGTSDYDFWRSHFANTSGSGAGGLSNSPVPEPSTLLLVAMSVLGVFTTRRAKS